MYKGDERRSKKNNTAWIIGIVISISVAVSGWLFAGLQSANAQTHTQIIDRVQVSESEIKDLKMNVNTLVTKMDILIDEMKTFIKGR
jgi:hypothetical protein